MTTPFMAFFMPAMLIWFYTDESWFVREVYIWTHNERFDITERWIDILYTNNKEFSEGVDQWNEDYGHLRHKEQIQVAKHGLPTLMMKIYQLRFLLYGDFEFMTNTDYLEFREKRLWVLMIMPYQLLFYNIHTAVFMIFWMAYSVFYFCIQLIVVTVNGAAISLSDEEHDMSWDSYLERHMTHYSYEM